MARTILEERRGDRWAPDFPAPGETFVAKVVALGGAYRERPWPFLYFVVRERTTGQLVGGAGFHAPPRQRAVEIGYGLAPSARRRGLAKESVGILVDVARASGSVDVVVATCEPDNLPSQAVLQRAGFSAMNDRASLWIARL